MAGRRLCALACLLVSDYPSSLPVQGSLPHNRLVPQALAAVDFRRMAPVVLTEGLPHPILVPITSVHLFVILTMYGLSLPGSGPHRREPGSNQPTSYTPAMPSHQACAWLLELPSKNLPLQPSSALARQAIFVFATRINQLMSLNRFCHWIISL